MECCICKKEIVGLGNNARPLVKGICCDVCNIKVIEKRLNKKLEMEIKNE